MKLQADLIECKEGILVFNTGCYTPELEINKKYNLTVKNFKSDRSLEQNRLMWGIINQISKASGMENNQLYIKGLRHANVTSEVVYCKTDEAIKGQYRAVEFLSLATLKDGTMLEVYNVWKGSSKYDSKEMTDLINYFTSLAYEYGIEIN